jgi:hypothetical protein
VFKRETTYEANPSAFHRSGVRHFFGALAYVVGVLVWAGGAQPLIDFIFRLHMITPPYQVAAFSLGTAAGLVLVTAAIGYVFGWVIGVIWNTYGPASGSDAK